MKTPLKAGLIVAPLAAVAVALGTLFWIPAGGGASSSTFSAYSGSSDDGLAIQPAKLDPGQMVELEVKDVIPIEEADTHAVVLVSKDQQVMLPIFVTEEAAVSIAFRLAERTSPHPLAADLMDKLVQQMGGQVKEVRIENVKDDIYTSSVVVHQGEKDLTLDARPSDAIAMALTGKAKIVCNKDVLSKAGITKGEIDQLRNHLGVGGGGAAGTPDQDNDEGPAIPHSKKAHPVPSEPDETNIRL